MGTTATVLVCDIWCESRGGDTKSSDDEQYTFLGMVSFGNKDAIDGAKNVREQAPYCIVYQRIRKLRFIRHQLFKVVSSAAAVIDLSECHVYIHVTDISQQ